MQVGGDGGQVAHLRLFMVLGVLTSLIYTLYYALFNYSVVLFVALIALLWYFSRNTRKVVPRNLSETVHELLSDVAAPSRSIVPAQEASIFVVNETARLYSGVGLVPGEEVDEEKQKRFIRGELFIEYAGLFSRTFTSGDEQRQKIMHKHEEIEKKRSLVGGDEVMDSLLVDMIYNTNRIEGSTLSRKETDRIVHALINHEDVEMPLLEGMEVVSWVAAWNYAKTLISLPTIQLRLKHIKKIHHLLMLDNYGLRRSPKDQVIISRTKVLLARPEEVTALMEALMDWLHEEVCLNRSHIIDVVIDFHAYFVRIHPFKDGNGRMARLLSVLILLQNHYQPLIMCTAEPMEYKDALADWDNGNTQTFGELMLQELDHAQNIYLSHLGITNL